MRDDLLPDALALRRDLRNNKKRDPQPEVDARIRSAPDRCGLRAVLCHSRGGAPAPPRLDRRAMDGAIPGKPP